MKRVFITGCCGFLASHLLDLLEKEPNIEIFGMDAVEAEALQSRCAKFFRIDISDRQSFFAAIEEAKPDLTFHLAAISNVGFSWKHPHLTYQVNFLGSSSMMEAVSCFSPGSRIVLMSSAELYGSTKKELIDEQSGLSANNPYCLSKYAMEMAANLYTASTGLDIIKIRAFNFIGPGQGNSFAAADFSSQIADIEKGNREPVIRVGNLSAVRDFSDVRDIARYLHVISQKKGRGGIYNLCSGKPYSIQDILDILLSFSQQEIEVRVDESKLRPVDIPRLAGDCSLIRKKFALYPEYDIKQTLLDTLNYWRNRVK